VLWGDPAEKRVEGEAEEKTGEGAALRHPFLAHQPYNTVTFVCEHRSGVTVEEEEDGDEVRKMSFKFAQDKSTRNGLVAIPDVHLEEPPVRVFGK
jgi:hypothetical protein